MTVEYPEMKSQVARFTAERQSEQSALNALRLADWQARYPRDVVSVPVPVNPPEWPCKRISLEIPAKVTRLRARG